MTTHSNQLNSTLTIEGLLATIEQFRDKFTIWYGMQKEVTPGKYIYCKATEYGPAFIVCHPDNLDTLRKATPGWTWRHLREWVPEYQPTRVVGADEAFYQVDP